ncbi:unnamed protein product [Amoebophrya sp. A120]|nr:unnamed protein product [Amoebophrya sp. A120]|eukprot:GSA120T00016972001.1
MDLDLRAKPKTGTKWSSGASVNTAQTPSSSTAPAGGDQLAAGMRESLREVSKLAEFASRHGHQAFRTKSLSQQHDELAGRMRAINLFRFHPGGRVVDLTGEEIDTYHRLKEQRWEVIEKLYAEQLQALRTEEHRGTSVAASQTTSAGAAALPLSHSDREPTDPQVEIGLKERGQERASTTCKETSTSPTFCTRTTCTKGRKAKKKRSSVDETETGRKRVDAVMLVADTIKAKQEHRYRIKCMLYDTLHFYKRTFMLPSVETLMVGEGVTSNAADTLDHGKTQISFCLDKWVDFIVDCENDSFFRICLLWFWPCSPKTDLAWSRFVEAARHDRSKGGARRGTTTSVDASEDDIRVRPCAFVDSTRNDEALRERLDSELASCMYAWRNLLAGRFRAAASVCRDITKHLRLTCPSVFLCECFALLILRCQVQTEEEFDAISPGRTWSDAAADLRGTKVGKAVIVQQFSETLRTLDRYAAAVCLLLYRSSKRKAILHFVTSGDEMSAGPGRYLIQQTLFAVWAVAMKEHFWGDADKGMAEAMAPAVESFEEQVEQQGKDEIKGTKATAKSKAQRDFEKKNALEIATLTRHDGVWNITPDLVVYSQDPRVKRISDDTFAAIHPDLELSDELRAEFSAALEKGMCAKQHKANGVKFLSNGVAELKINGDTRLWTSTKYKEHKQESKDVDDPLQEAKVRKTLLLFDHEDNHGGVRRAVELQKSGNMKEVLCDQPQQTDEVRCGDINRKKAEVRSIFNSVMTGRPRFVRDALGIEPDATVEEACPIQ